MLCRAKSALGLAPAAVLRHHLSGDLKLRRQLAVRVPRAEV